MSREGSRRWSWRSSRWVRQSPLGLAPSLAVTLKAIGSPDRILAGLGNGVIHVFKRLCQPVRGWVVGRQDESKETVAVAPVGADGGPAWGGGGGDREFAGKHNRACCGLREGIRERWTQS